jgi:hypothetical protein
VMKETLEKTARRWERASQSGANAQIVTTF